MASWLPVKFLAVTEKLVVNAAPGTVADTGTVRFKLSLETATPIPPGGAFRSMAKVQVPEFLGPSVAGAQSSEMTEIEATRKTSSDPVVPLKPAVTTAF